MVNIKKVIRRISIIDWLIILICVGVAIFAAVNLGKKTSWVQVEVKITSQEWWWDSKPPPYWLADKVGKGDSQYNIVGQKIAEVIDIKNYSWGGTRKDLYLSLNLKVNYNKQKQTMFFNNQPVEIGQNMYFELGKVKIPGLVVSTGNDASGKKEIEKIVKAKLISVYPWVAQAINPGAKMTDTNDRVKAEILDKQIELADMTVTTDTGEVLARKDPLKRDVYLKIKLMVEKGKGFYFFRDGQEVKVGNNLWIQLENVDIAGAAITEITQ